MGGIYAEFSHIIKPCEGGVPVGDVNRKEYTVWRADGSRSDVVNAREIFVRKVMIELKSRGRLGNPQEGPAAVQAARERASAKALWRESATQPSPVPSAHSGAHRHGSPSPPPIYLDLAVIRMFNSHFIQTKPSSIGLNHGKGGTNLFIRGETFDANCMKPGLLCYYYYKENPLCPESHSR